MLNKGGRLFSTGNTSGGGVFAQGGHLRVLGAAKSCLPQCLHGGGGIFEQSVKCRSRSHGKDPAALRVVWTDLCDEGELGEWQPWSWQRQP